MGERIQFEISTWTIIKTVLILLAIYFLFLVRDIIALLFIVFILVATFRPLVNRWEKKIGRLPAVVSLVLIAISATALIVYLVIPPIVSQVSQLVTTLPSFADRFETLRSYTPALRQGIDTISKNVGNLTSGFISLTANLFGGIITFLTAIVMTIYLLLDKKSLSGFVASFFPENRREPIVDLTKKIVRKVGDWFRGQVILGIIIAAIDFIGLLIMGVPFALTLAVISGLLEIIPTIGPIIAGLIAAVVALTVSPLLALLVIIFYIVVQQLENTVIVPKVMQKAVGLSPVVIILAILIGAKLMGIVGAILAVPLVASLHVIIQEWSNISETLSK